MVVCETFYINANGTKEYYSAELDLKRTDKGHMHRHIESRWRTAVDTVELLEDVKIV